MAKYILRYVPNYWEPLSNIDLDQAFDNGRQEVKLCKPTSQDSENGDFHYKLDVSGFRASELSVSVEGNNLWIHGKRNGNHGLA